MRLRPEQLAGHLKRPLAPVYLVHGDEPLLVQESADALRAAARSQGFEERQVLVAETGFDWGALAATAASASLFAVRRLLEVRLGGSKPGDAGAKALKAYAARPAPDALLLVLCDKLDGATLKSGWVGALEQAGVAIQVRQPPLEALPRWIEERLRSRRLIPESGLAALLAQRVEGNLLAAAQEIDKLAVLFPDGRVSCNDLLAVVADSARFSVYDLVDAALEGRAERSLRILNGLKGEGLEPPLILWALHREIRLLYGLTADLDRGLPPGAALERRGVWQQRRPLLGRALNRLDLAACRRLLQATARVDRIAKGAEKGPLWDELLNVVLSLAGCRLGTETTGVAKLS